MADAAVLLKDDRNIKELLQAMQKSGKKAQRRNLLAIIKYVDTMEKQLDTVIGELQSVQRQLDDIKDRQNPVRNAYIKVTKTLESKTTEVKQKLSKIKEGIRNGAKRAVSAFKEKGTMALDGVLKFFDVKDGLTALQEDLQKAVASSEKAIAKIDAISAEYHEIGKHIKNLGRAVVGKEAIKERKPNGRLARTAQAPHRVANSVRNTVLKGVSAAIRKVDGIDTAASKKLDNKEKPSILLNIKDYKPKEKSAAASGKSKSKEESL